jgi:predicted amidohydrolase
VSYTQEDGSEKVYNSQLVIAPNGDVVEVYDKHHLYDAVGPCLISTMLPTARLPTFPYPLYHGDEPYVLAMNPSMNPTSSRRTRL